MRGKVTVPMVHLDMKITMKHSIKYLKQNRTKYRMNASKQIKTTGRTNIRATTGNIMKYI